MITDLADVRRRTTIADLERAKRLFGEVVDILIAAMHESLASASFTTPLADEPEVAIDAHTVAKIIDKDPSTVREMARMGRIPAYSQPGTGTGERQTWRFFRSEIDAWMRGDWPAPTSKPARVGRTVAHK